MYYHTIMGGGWSLVPPMGEMKKRIVEVLKKKKNGFFVFVQWIKINRFLV